MNLRPMMIVFVLLNTAGCSYVHYSIVNLYSAPVDCLNEACFRKRMHQQAREAWCEIAKTEGQNASKAYVEGFEAGFVDYVDANGNGDPPATPPAHLRRKEVHQMSGPGEIEDWYAGFRRGAEEARARGLRENVVVPISRPPRNVTAPQEFRPEFIPPMPEQKSELLPFPKADPD